MQPAIKILPNYSYDDYILWEGRWEVIDGIPYAMSPSPTPRHQWISANIMAEFRNALNKAGFKHCKVYNFLDYQVSDHTILQPDALIICDEITKNFLDFPPALVVEILSPSTAMKDRNNKFSIYQSQGIPYYLILDTDKELVEIYVLENNKYVLAETPVGGIFDFSLDGDCHLQLPLAEVWK